MTKIFVPQPIADVAVARLKELGEVTVFPHLDRQISKAELLDAVRDKDVLFAVGDIPFDAAVIEAAEELKFISAMHGAATFVDFAAATRRNVPVAGIPYRILLETTAEFTFALLMATAWRLPEADRFLRDGKWAQNQSMAFEGTRLHGKTLGIVGMGRIGQMVAHRGAACNMRIIYSKRTQLSTAEELVFGGAGFRTVEELFSEADFVVVTVPLTNQTKGLVGERLLSLMKPSAIFINTSRGAVVDEAALEKALREKRIRGAGLDVYQKEVPDPNPGPSESFKGLPNVVFTPHIGSAARDTREEMALRTVQNIEEFLAGKRPAMIFNPEVYGEAPVKSERLS
jgi:glyoxylate reductase